MDRALALSPGMNGARAAIGDARVMLGDLAGALSDYHAETNPVARLTGLAIILRRLGNNAGATAAMREIISRFGDSAAYQMAEIDAQWLDIDAAFSNLDKALRLGDQGLAQVFGDPFLDPVRRDPRFVGILRSLHLT